MSRRALIVGAYRQHYAQLWQQPALFPGVRDALVALRESGCFLAVATGKSRAGLNKALHLTELGDLFHATRTADESEPKPSPAMIHDILAELDVRAGESLMVGDTEFDLAMARAASTRVAGVAFGAHSVARLLAYDPEFILNDFTQLTKALNALNDALRTQVRDRTYDH
jgi:phosphoglycolate phosphatase